MTEFETQVVNLMARLVSVAERDLSGPEMAKQLGDILRSTSGAAIAKLTEALNDRTMKGVV